MIRPTILWALSLAMLGGALFGLAFSLRPPAGRAYPGAFRRLSAWWEVRALSPASRLGVERAAVVRRGPARPSPLIPLAAARHGIAASGEGSSYRDALDGLARTQVRVASVHGGTSSPAPRRWSTPCDWPEATR